MATSPPPYNDITGIYTVIDKHHAVSKADFEGTARPGQIVVDTSDYSLHVADDTGSLNAVGSGGGGGTTSPAGADTEIQFNNAGDFGSSSQLTFNGGELFVDADLAVEANAIIKGDAEVQGTLVAQVFHEKSVTMVGNNVDLTLANYFTKTITGPTTLTVSGIPAPGTAIMICVTLINGGTNVTFFPGTKWSNGTPPVLTVTGTDILGFFTVDGGTTWRGLILAMDSR